jgi:2'-5' RNA ligase superfamily
MSARDYWRQRPGWRAGFDFYACQLTLEDQPGLRDLVRRYQDAIADPGSMYLIPARWLHVTMQPIGFADEIGPAEVASLTERIGERLRDLSPPTATFRRPSVSKRAAYLTAEPREPIYRVRLAMYDAVAAALGPDRFGLDRPDPARFRPHVSFVYADEEGSARPLCDSFGGADFGPVTATFTSASLVAYHRGQRMHEWTRTTRLPIGPG